MCNVIYIECQINFVNGKTRKEFIDYVEELGFRGLSFNHKGICIDGYGKSCFCNPPYGWRDALKTLVFDLVGENYYISLPLSGDMVISKGDMPAEIKDKIDNSTEELQKELNKIVKNPQLGEVDVEALNKAVLNYRACKRSYMAGDLDEVDF